MPQPNYGNRFSANPFGLRMAGVAAGSDIGSAMLGAQPQQPNPLGGILSPWAAAGQQAAQAAASQAATPMQARLSPLAAFGGAAGAGAQAVPQPATVGSGPFSVPPGAAMNNRPVATDMPNFPGGAEREAARQESLQSGGNFSGAVPDRTLEQRLADAMGNFTNQNTMRWDRQTGTYALAPGPGAERQQQAANILAGLTESRERQGAESARSAEENRSRLDAARIEARSRHRMTETDERTMVEQEADQLAANNPALQRDRVAARAAARQRLGLPPQQPAGQAQAPSPGATQPNTTQPQASSGQRTPVQTAMDGLQGDTPQAVLADMRRKNPMADQFIEQNYDEVVRVLEERFGQPTVQRATRGSGFEWMPGQNPLWVNPWATATDGQTALANLRELAIRRGQQQFGALPGGRFLGGRPIVADPFGSTITPGGR